MKRGNASSEVTPRVNHTNRRQASDEAVRDAVAVSLHDRMKWLEQDVVKKVVRYYISFGSALHKITIYLISSV